MTVYYVCASTGSNANTGTSQNTPFMTIQAAANIAAPGDTIVVAPGIYRERVAPKRGGTQTAPIIYKSQIKQQAIIRGSVPWQPTRQVSNTSNNIWSGAVDNGLFMDTSPIDGANPFKIPVSVTPYGRNGKPEAANAIAGSDPNMIYSLGQVFVDDTMFIQCPYYTEMQTNANTWFYDNTKEILYIHFSDNVLSPQNHSIEITNQRRVFAPHTRGLSYIVVDGFVIERCGNNYPNQFWTTPQNQQAGMIGTRSGKYWTIQNNVIQYANAIGIDWGNEGGSSQDSETGANGAASGAYGHVIKNNVIQDNGAAGTASYMGKSFVFTNNLVQRNNNLRFYGKRRWESAGVKVHQPTNSVIQNNIIQDNFCHGVWSDQGAGTNSVFKNNVIKNNQGSGINYEIGVATTGNVTNNIFWNNQYGVSFTTSGGVNVANNAFLGSQIADIYTNLFTRTADKWDSNNVVIHHNLFVGQNTYLQLSQPDSTVPSTRTLHHNVYAYDTVPNQPPSFALLPPINTNVPSIQPHFRDWQKYWQQTNGSEVNSQVIQNKYLYDNSANLLTLQISELPATDAVPTLPNQTDYFGNVFTDNIAGPFANLQLGANVFQL
jgi:hypothetical protein